MLKHLILGTSPLWRHIFKTTSQSRCLFHLSILSKKLKLMVFSGRLRARGVNKLFPGHAGNCGSHESSEAGPLDYCILGGVQPKWEVARRKEVGKGLGGGIFIQMCSDCQWILTRCMADERGGCGSMSSWDGTWPHAWICVSIICEQEAQGSNNREKENSPNEIEKKQQLFLKNLLFPFIYFISQSIQEWIRPFILIKTALSCRGELMQL